MLIHNGLSKIFIYKDACDMRKSIDKLSQLVAEEFESNATNGDLYIFMNKKRDKVKILYWEKNGFWLCYKRLEKEVFKMPKIKDKAMEITIDQMQWLLSGLNIEKVKGFKKLKYRYFY
jgi:transposase